MSVSITLTNFVPDISFCNVQCQTSSVCEMCDSTLIPVPIGESMITNPGLYKIFNNNEPETPIGAFYVQKNGTIEQGIIFGNDLSANSIVNNTELSFSVNLIGTSMKFPLILRKSIYNTIINKLPVGAYTISFFSDIVSAFAIHKNDRGIPMLNDAIRIAFPTNTSIILEPKLADITTSLIYVKNKSNATIKFSNDNELFKLSPCNNVSYKFINAIPIFVTKLDKCNTSSSVGIIITDGNEATIIKNPKDFKIKINGSTITILDRKELLIDKLNKQLCLKDYSTKSIKIIRDLIEEIINVL